MSRPGMYTRRQILLVGGALATASISGCLADDEPTPEPVSIVGATCDVCGMVIGDHFGPSAQAFYRGGTPPDGRNGPVRFDSTAEAVTYHDDQRSRGHELIVMYVVDYSRVSYEIEEMNDTLRITAHPTRDAFVDAEGIYFVRDSDVFGSMGNDPIPFSDHEDAKVFTNAYGGSVVQFDDLFE